MLDFANGHLLVLLAIVPGILLLYFLARRARNANLKRFGKASTIASLMPDVSRYKPAIKLSLTLLALVAIIFVLARPRYGEKEDVASSEGIEVVIAFDVSNSMLASSTDEPKSTSRLKRAKMLLEKMVDKLQNDRVGMVVFAGESKVQLPMTSDHYIVKTFINDLEPSIIRAQGTSISKALEQSARLFGENKDDVHRAIIVITDAEDHEGAAVETAKEIAESGIQIDVVGVGTSKGAPIPLGNGQFMTDSEGKQVITAVNEQAGANIAEAGEGIYINGSVPTALDKLSGQLDKLGKSKFKQVKYKVNAEQFPLFAWLALILLVADIFVVYRKTSWLKNINFFTKTKK